MLVDGLTAMLVGPFLIPVPPLKGTFTPKDLDDNDRVVPTAGSIRLVDELTNTSLKMIENCGHLPHEEQPEAFMEAMRSILEAIPASWKVAIRLIPGYFVKGQG